MGQNCQIKIGKMSNYCGSKLFWSFWTKNGLLTYCVHFLALTCYWCPENFLLASAYYDPYFVLKFSRRQCHCGFHCFPSQVIILYDENQRMESENGKLKIALQLQLLFLLQTWEEALQQDLTTRVWLLNFRGFSKVKRELLGPMG